MSSSLTLAGWGAGDDVAIGAGGMLMRGEGVVNTNWRFRLGESLIPVSLKGVRCERFHTVVAEISLFFDSTDKSIEPIGTIWAMRRM